MVVTRKRASRSIFRKIPFGALYWTTGGVGAAPLMKIGRSNSLAGVTLSTGVPTLSSAIDATTVVIRVPYQFQHSTGRYV
jgi:hypothetical protein